MSGPTGSPTPDSGRPWGPHTARGVEVAGVSGRSLGSCPPLVVALGEVKAATARANGDAGVVPSDVSSALVDAARELASGSVPPEALPADLLAGGGSIAVHMNVNEILAGRAAERLGHPVDPKRHAGVSQSTADVCHTAARLAVLGRAELLVSTATAAVQSLRRLTHDLEGHTTLARTCLQDGLPAPLATVFVGAADALDRRLAAFVATLGPLHEVVLGGTVIGRGDGAPDAYRAVVVDHLAEETGRPLRPHPTPASALQHGDDLVAVSGALVQLTHPLFKLARDLRLLGSGPRGGFGEIVLPHVLDGSSFFAGKRNPVVPETLMQACLQVQGLDHTVQLAAGHTELYLQVLDGLVAVDLLDGLALLTEAIDRLDRFVLHDLRADPARCAELAALAPVAPVTGPAEPAPRSRVSA